jgi:hypothetical protein
MARSAGALLAGLVQLAPSGKLSTGGFMTMTDQHPITPPPSLKEQALHELNDVYNRDKIEDSTYDTIRRALEALDD